MFAIAKARSGRPGKKASSASNFARFMCGGVPLKYRTNIKLHIAVHRYKNYDIRDCHHEIKKQLQWLQTVLQHYVLNPS